MVLIRIYSSSYYAVLFASIKALTLVNVLNLSTLATQDISVHGVKAAANLHMFILMFKIPFTADFAQSRFFNRIRIH